MTKPRRQQKSESVVEQDGRQRAIERVRRKLLRGGRPRLLVSFLLALTGASGFLVSAALLRLGLTQMSVRYPLAVLLAYCVFLLLLRLWLTLQRRRGRGDGSDWLDFGDAVPNFFDAGGDAVRAATFGGGGDFGGGGAGGAWTGGDLSGGVPVADISGGGGASVGNVSGIGNVSGGGVSGGGGSSLLDSMPSVDLDLDDGCFWIIIPIAAIAGVLFLMFYVVYVAPVFLAEILVDALLLAGLYKRLKGVEPRHWLRSCVRRTLLPAMLSVALFIAAGYLMERVAPEARSIGEFWREISSPKPSR